MGADVSTDLAFVDQHDSKIRFDRVQHQVIDKHASEYKQFHNKQCVPIPIVQTRLSSLVLMHSSSSTVTYLRIIVFIVIVGRDDIGDSWQETTLADFATLTTFEVLPTVTLTFDKTL